MTRLHSLIHEVIVTTTNQTGVAHSVPMGISEVSGHFLIKPFKPSSTYENLKINPNCTINYVDDVRVFAGAIVGKNQWPLLAAKDIDGQYLDCALAHTELSVCDLEDNDPRACFKCEVISEYSHAPFRGFNRAQNAVVEAAILVSRLGMLSEDKIKTEIDYLMIAMQKTAGDREWEAWGWLIDKIKQAGISV